MLTTTAPELTISIHAPARGATSQIAMLTGAILPISIHAPARGATLYPFLHNG